jgi:tetratricopeptide (TPR) repeat protein
MNPNEDFLGAYREVTGKLKKRFLRKPNASQASEELSALGRRLNEQGAHSYAAFFSQTAARCEKEAGNEQREAEALTEAARRFLTTVRKAKRLKTLHLQEDLVSAIQCYRNAVELYVAQEQKALAAALDLEIADVLTVELERSSEAVSFYEEAVDLLCQNSAELLHAMGKLATCYLTLSKTNTKVVAGRL